MSTSSLSSPESDKDNKDVIVEYHENKSKRFDDDSLSEASTLPISPARSKSSSDLSEPPEDINNNSDTGNINNVKNNSVSSHDSSTLSKLEPTLTSALDPIQGVDPALNKDPSPNAVGPPTTEKEVGAGEALIDMAIDGEVKESPNEITNKGQNNDEEQHDETNDNDNNNKNNNLEDDEKNNQDNDIDNDNDNDENENDDSNLDTPINIHGSSTAYHVDDEREEALAFLTKLEIEFAMLRNRLYVERMEEIARESAMIEDGSHPELMHLHNILSNRRETRLTLAATRLRKLEQSYNVSYQAEQESAWRNWVEGIKKLHFGQGDAVESGSYGWGFGLQGNDRKRRRLEREKRFLEIPKTLKREPLNQLQPMPVVQQETELIQSAPVSNGRGRRGKKRSKGTQRKNGVEERNKTTSFITWEDVNSSYGEPLGSLEDNQLSSQALEEDLEAMRLKQHELSMSRQVSIDAHNQPFDNASSNMNRILSPQPILSNYPSPTTSLPPVLSEVSERPGLVQRGYSLDSAPP